MKVVLAVLVSSLVFPLATYAQSKTVAEVDKCIMSVTAKSGLSPSDEASRKVNCFHGATNMVDKCERTVGGTMRLNSQSEQHLRQRCREVAK